MAIQGGAITSAGSTLYIADLAVLPATFDEAGYEALTWVKVGMITEIPEFMPSATINSVMILDSRTPLKTKGSTDPGDLTIPMVRDVTDLGQAIISVASRDDRSYSWKIETSSDFTPDTGHPLTFYSTAKIGGYSVVIGGVDSTIMSNVPFAIDRLPVESAAV
jgi:hypothetical protein